MWASAVLARLRAHMTVLCNSSSVQPLSQPLQLLSQSHLAGFTLKIAALVLSSFREVGGHEPFL